ncbi:uncharacterized protein LOC142354033 [Convolutriloba macropyga]|uniref:uncharacterized protein LOC142354033 n=1 Tax=Convolutriloba macropyga TaxID=536237 RepID=UPI003F5258B6
MECDPEFFYVYYLPIDLNHTIVNSSILFYFGEFLKAFVLFHAPFLIVLPFCNKRLRTTCRKVISMVVLSDSLISISVIAFEKSGIYFEEGSLLSVCFLVNLMLDAVILWSQLWSLMLILHVFLLLNPTAQFKPQSTDCHFIIYNFLVWSCGILLPLLTSGLPFYPLMFSNTYVATSTCRGKFTFRLNDQLSDCLLADGGKMIWLLYYFGIVAILLIAVILCGVALRRANTLRFKPSKRKASLMKSSELVDAFNSSNSHSEIVWRTTIRLSLTALVYISSVLPAVIYRVYEIENGPIRSENVRGVLNLWLQFAGYIIGASNIIFYGYFSPLFRLEIVRLKSYVLGTALKTLAGLVGQTNSVKDPSEYDVIFDLDPATMSDRGYESETRTIGTSKSSFL